MTATTSILVPIAPAILCTSSYCTSPYSKRSTSYNSTPARGRVQVVAVAAGSTTGVWRHCVRHHSIVDTGHIISSRKGKEAAVLLSYYIPVPGGEGASRGVYAWLVVFMKVTGGLLLLCCRLSTVDTTTTTTAYSITRQRTPALLGQGCTPASSTTGKAGRKTTSSDTSVEVSPLIYPKSRVSVSRDFG